MVNYNYDNRFPEPGIDLEFPPLVYAAPPIRAWVAQYLDENFPVGDAVAAADEAKTYRDQAAASAVSASQVADQLPAQVTALKNEDIAHVMQTGSVLPPRPPRKLVYWHCWSDPSSFMEGADVWLQIPDQTGVPAEVPADMWDWQPSRESGEMMLRVNYVPNLVPAITGIRYRVDGGPWVDIAAVRGYTLVGGLSNATPYGAQIQLANYNGWGASSAVKTAAPVIAAMAADTFARADGVLLSTVPEWDCKNGTTLVHAAGGVNRSTAGQGSNPYGGSNAPAGGLAVHRGYFTDAQWVECEFAGVGLNISFGPGMLLQADTALARGGQGYAILPKPSSARIYKNIDGAFQLVNTSFFPTLAAPQRLRAEFDPETGIIVLKDLNSAGAVIATWADVSGTPLPTLGRPGIQSTWPGSGTSEAGRVNDFKAGNL